MYCPLNLKKFQNIASVHDEVKATLMHEKNKKKSMKSSDTCMRRLYHLSIPTVVRLTERSHAFHVAVSTARIVMSLLCEGGGSRDPRVVYNITSAGLYSHLLAQYLLDVVGATKFDGVKSIKKSGLCINGHGE